MLHKLKYIIVDFGIFADTAQVIADNWQIILARIYLLNATYPFYRTFFQTMTTDSIHRVGGIDNKSAIIQDINDSL